MHRDLQLNQIFSWSPVPEYSDYRSPVHRFYLCGQVLTLVVASVGSPFTTRRVRTHTV